MMQETTRRQRQPEARLLQAAFEIQDRCGFAAGDTNLRRYVSNNPTTRTDPSGLFPPPDPPAQEAIRRLASGEGDGSVVADIAARLASGEELKKRAAAGIVTVQIPKSGDGSPGEHMYLRNYTIQEIQIDRVGTGTAPFLVKLEMARRSPKELKDLVRKQIQDNFPGGKGVGRGNYPSGVEPDLDKKIRWENKTIVLDLKDHPFYGEDKDGNPLDWYITVTGTIRIKAEEAEISPTKKK
jgi:hypothetical protein